MNNKPECDVSYLHVLQMWAKSAFHHLCSDIANAETPAAKALAFEQLKNDAPKYTAIVQGTDMLCADSLRADEMATLAGQVGVAKDVFQSILANGLCSEHCAAITAWLQDVEESQICEKETVNGNGFEDGSSDGCCDDGCECGRDANRPCRHLD